MNYIVKPAAVLFVTVVVMVVALTFVQDFTAAPIAAQLQRMQENAMKEVLPAADEYVELASVQPSGSLVRVFEGKKGGQVIGYVIELGPEGYDGVIDMMVGLLIDENVISGLRVMKHTETPGLGALITKQSFYDKFENQPIDPLKVVKLGAGVSEIDALTAATISTVAVTDAVNEAIEWYQGGAGR